MEEEKNELINESQNNSSSKITIPQSTKIPVKNTKKGLKVPIWILLLIFIIIISGGGFFCYIKFSPEFKFKKAKIAYENKNFRNTIEILEKIKDKIDITKYEKFNYYLADSYYNLKDFNNARQEFELVLRKGISFDILIKLADTCLQLKEEKKGIRYLISASKIKKDYDLISRIADLAFKLNDFQTAIEYYSVLKTNNKIDDVALVNLGIAYYEIGYLDNSYNNLITVFLKNQNIENLKKYIGLIFYTKSDYKKAENLLSEVFEKNPGDPDIVLNLVDIYYSDKDYKNCEKICKNGISARNSKAPYLTYYLATISMKNNKTKEALLYLKNAVTEKNYLKKIAKTDTDFIKIAKNKTFLNIIN